MTMYPIPEEEIPEGQVNWGGVIVGARAFCRCGWSETVESFDREVRIEKMALKKLSAHVRRWHGGSIETLVGPWSEYMPPPTD